MELWQSANRSRNMPFGMESENLASHGMNIQVRQLNLSKDVESATRSKTFVIQPCSKSAMPMVS
jgi:hypothetical protein